MKILLTGAGGLLGSDIFNGLSAQCDRLGIEAILRQRRGAAEGFFSADLSRPEGAAALAMLDWDVIIHTAAAKDPDFCETHPAEAEALNAAATAYLAKEAARRQAKFIYICTDYVFPGTNAPYSEDSVPAPINIYGQTKLAGELAVLAASTENCSLRIPVIYGLGAGVKHSAVLSGSLAAILDKTSRTIDDAIIRYPTCTLDVAAAVVLLLEKNGKGIFHCTGADRQTKYDMCVTLAEVMGLSHCHIQRLATPPPSAAVRPIDSHLTMTRLPQLGFRLGMSFAERLVSFRPELTAYLRSLS